MRSRDDKARSAPVEPASAFAHELAEFLKANPEKLDPHWAALLSKSNDPSIRLVVSALEAGMGLASADTATLDALAIPRPIPPTFPRPRPTPVLSW